MLGPSGSGKTTTLRLIAGFEKPDRGTIELDGQDVTALPPFERNVNTVFQDYALFPHMTVAGNIAYGLEVHAPCRARRSPRGCRRRCAWCGSSRTASAAGAALRRPAPARRPGARHRQPAGGAAARRAARRARSQAPPGDAIRAQAHPGRGRHHLPLRHPRPGGSADDERPHRDLQSRPHRADRHARRRSTSGR